MDTTGAAATGGEQHEPLLEFLVSEVWLAVPPNTVEEIVDLGQLTPVPRAPDHVRGLLNLRGHAVPIVDLAVFLSLRGREEPAARSGEEGARQRILVVRANDMRVGLVADRVRGVVEVPGSALRSPQVVQGRRLQEFAVAEHEEADRLTVKLDLGALLDAARLRR